MKFTLKEIILAGLLIFISMLYTCNKMKMSDKDDQITQLQLDKQKSDSTVNDYGQIIYTQDVIISDKQSALEELTDTIFNLKKSEQKKIANVIAYYKGVTKTVIKNVNVPYVDTVATKKWEDSVAKQCSEVINYYEKNAIEVPKQASDSTADYKIDLTVKKDRVTIDNLEIPDRQDIRFVTLKGGLFKKDLEGKRHFWLKKQIQVQVLHTNKLIHVIGQNSAIYVPTKKGRWLEKAILIGAGIFIGTQIK